MTLFIEKMWEAHLSLHFWDQSSCGSLSPWNIQIHIHNVHNYILISYSQCSQQFVHRKDVGGTSLAVLSLFFCDLSSCDFLSPWNIQIHIYNVHNNNIQIVIHNVHNQNVHNNSFTKRCGRQVSRPPVSIFGTPHLLACTLSSLSLSW